MPSLTIRHLFNDQADSTRYVFDPAAAAGRVYRVERFAFSHVPIRKFVAERFAKDLLDFGHTTSVIADSNFYLSETERCIWDALFANRQLTMVGPVAREIHHWIDDPRGINLYAHAVVKDAYHRKNNIVTGFSIPNDNELQYAADWYVNLMGMRKDMRSSLRCELSEGRASTPSNDEVNDILRKRFGARALRLAISGDGGKIAAHRYHDEAIVTIAIIHALVTGQNTIVLTRDENVLEQFRKTCWLIDTHYRSMLMATIYARDPFAFMPIVRGRDLSCELRAQLSKAFSDVDDVILARKPSGTLLELVPPDTTLLPIHCCLVRELSEIVTFGLVKEFVQVLRVKCISSGANTNELGGRNCHITLGPLIYKVGNWAAIGRDRVVCKGRFPYSMIDANLATSAVEHVSRVISTRVVV